MSLLDYGRILVRRGWIMVLLALIAAGSAYVLSRAQTPQYRATQLVLIQPARPDLSLTNSTQALLNPLVVYLDSRERAAEVINQLRVDMTPDQLMGAADIVADRDRYVIQIDVTMPDLALASDVARQWGTLLVEYRDRINQTARQEDRVVALLPDAPSGGLFSPRTTINVLAGAVLGLVVGAVIVFVLEFIESAIIRRRDDIERLGLPVLITVPDNR